MLDTPNRNQSDFACLTGSLSAVKPATALRKIRPILEATRRWRFRAPALMAAFAAVWYFGVPFALGPLVYVQPVLRAEFVQGVVASGHVEAPFRVNIGSQVTGVVVDIPVEEGQSVKVGDILIVLDDRVNRTNGTTFLLVTHNMDLARRCDRIVEVVDGRIRVCAEASNL